MSRPRSPAELAAAHRLRQQRLAVLARSQLRRLWRFVDARDPQGSWALVARRAATLVGTAQLEAARGADDYVAAVLAAAGAGTDPAGATVAAAFAGTAADGRDLAGLLGYPAFEVAAFLDRGMAGNAALSVGGRHLDRIVMTEVGDAARTATGVAVVNDRTVRGFVRHLTLPSCGRCVVLAGRWYAVNAGFQRHPQCDCVHLPAAEVIEPQSPRALFDQMTPEQQTAAFTVAGAQAVRDGADVARVVNARRGMYTAGGRRFTREATTRRGTGRRVRLMPETLYSEAQRLGWSRDEVIRQLRLHGYIV